MKSSGNKTFFNVFSLSFLALLKPHAAEEWLWRWRCRKLFVCPRRTGYIHPHQNSACRAWESGLVSLPMCRHSWKSDLKVVSSFCSGRFNVGGAAWRFKAGVAKCRLKKRKQQSSLPNTTDLRQVSLKQETRLQHLSRLAHSASRPFSCPPT